MSIPASQKNWDEICPATRGRGLCICATPASPSGRPVIVCLCGSTRFGNFFHEANLRLTLAGEIVLSIGCDTKSDDDLAAAGDVDWQSAKAGLDALHKRKIDLADYVLVVSDESGYFGDSTWSEILYARSLGKPVKFAEPRAEARALAFAEEEPA